MAVEVQHVAAHAAEGVGVALGDGAGVFGAVLPGGAQAAGSAIAHLGIQRLLEHEDRPGRSEDAPHEEETGLRNNAPREPEVEIVGEIGIHGVAEIAVGLGGKTGHRARGGALPEPVGGFVSCGIIAPRPFAHVGRHQIHVPFVARVGSFDLPLLAVGVGQESLVVGGIGQESDAPEAQVGFAGALHGQIPGFSERGNQDGGQQGQNGDHHEQFHESEPRRSCARSPRPGAGGGHLFPCLADLHHCRSRIR